MMNKLGAEFVGTFWLVFGGCGSAVLAAGFPELGIGFVGVSMAFGLTVLTMAYAVGHISGGHFNPAVSLGLALGNRFSWGEIPGYWAAQVLGSFTAAGILYVIASGAPGFEAGGFASNGFGELSPGGYSMAAALVAEIVLKAGDVQSWDRDLFGPDIDLEGSGGEVSGVILMFRPVLGVHGGPRC